MHLVTAASSVAYYIAGSDALLRMFRGLLVVGFLLFCSAASSIRREYLRESFSDESRNATQQCRLGRAAILPVSRQGSNTKKLFKAPLRWPSRR